MSLPGRATPEGTRRYRDRLVAQGVARGSFRQTRGIWISTVGMGTYLGGADAATDACYVEAALEAARMGCNLFDTAINYRHQRSERALGEALRRMEAEGIARRDEVVVASKGGFVPFDGGMPEDVRAYLAREYLLPGLLVPGEVCGGMHCMSPRFLEDQICRSLRNLGLETLDVYYIHNPEAQAAEVGAAAVHRRLGEAFAALQARVAAGALGCYGTATWDGYRVPPGEPEHLDLHALAALAESVGGREHGFRFVQAPFNLAMPEALGAPTQPGPAGPVPLLEAAGRHGIAVIGSASLLQARLASGLPPELEDTLPGMETDAQRAIQFCRSAPGLTAGLVGMSRLEHVRENLRVNRLAPASEVQIRRLFPGRP